MSRMSYLIEKEINALFGNRIMALSFFIASLGVPAGYIIVLIYYVLSSSEPGAGFPDSFRLCLSFISMLPSVAGMLIAVESIAGEREQGTLEPLLATPCREKDILLSKSFVPIIYPVLLSWLATIIFTGAAIILMGRIRSFIIINLTDVAVTMMMTLISTVLAVSLSILLSTFASSTWKVGVPMLFVQAALFALLFYYREAVLFGDRGIAFQALIFGILLIAAAILSFFAAKRFKRDLLVPDRR